MLYCLASYPIQFEGSPHEHSRRHEFLRERLYNPAFWERLWRTAGIQSVFCFIVAYIVYGQQPQVGALADALAAF